jgi:low-affinity ferrous iron transport protein
MEKCFTALFEADALLEKKLRQLSDDIRPNEKVDIPPPVTTKLARVVDFYVAVIGTLIGIGILVLFMVIWISLGPAMHWSSNWTLISGTYAGLIGMNDCFVFINAYYRHVLYEDKQFDEVKCNDLDVFSTLQIELPDELDKNNSLDFRTSKFLGKILAKDIVAASGAIILIGLVTGSSVMRWSITGQLLSNIPPMLIETFLMMALITRHNISDSNRRVDVTNMFNRRIVLMYYLDNLVLYREEKD